MKETELQFRLRKSIEALADARNNEAALRKSLHDATDTTAKAKARFEELFLAEEKAEVARRKQGS